MIVGDNAGGHTAARAQQTSTITDCHVSVDQGLTNELMPMYECRRIYILPH